MKKTIFAICATSVLASGWVYMKFSEHKQIVLAEKQELIKKESLAKKALAENIKKEEIQKERRLSLIRRTHSSDLFPDREDGPGVEETIKLEKQKSKVAAKATSSRPSKTKKSRITKKKSQQVVAYAKKFLGVKYLFGGENIKKEIDCSAFTKHIMKKKCNITIPRTAAKQASSGKHVDKKNLRAGDLVFFKGTSKHAHISHVGIMISKTKFIHASSGARKVVITKLYKPYYIKHYFGARRL